VTTTTTRNLAEPVHAYIVAATARLHIALALLGAFVSGACAVDGADDEPLASTAAAATVGSYVSTSRSTSVVLGLSKQIAEEVRCMMPGALVSFEEGNGIVFAGSAVLPYVSPEAKADLLAAVKSAGGTLQVTSAYRTVVQQYLLYRWYQDGRCGITAAATPGNSNHESGRAIDVSNYDAWIGALENRGWSHSVPGDPVHFDHLGSPDIRGADVLAFQRLWNRNHPEDPIDEDGDYGPMTADRLAKAPAEGFGQGADCSAPPAGGAWNAARAGADVPAEAGSGARVQVWVELENTGTSAWQPGEVFLGTTSPRDRESALFDAANWVSPSRTTSVDAATAPGAVGRFSFMVQLPTVDRDTMISESFGLVREGVAWFGPEDVAVEILVKAPGKADDPGGGPGGGADGEGGVGGGCAVTPGRRAGDAAWWAALAAALVARRRRRR
jgi:MYXO-CTERM domain-containing protein